MKNNIISFDFDGTLNDHFGGEVVEYKKITRDWVKRLMRRGYEVYIITRRYGPENSHKGKTNEHLIVWEIASQLGIPKNRIIFTNREWKYTQIENIGSGIHIDDDAHEKYWLERHAPEVKVIHLEESDWESQLISKLETHDPFKIWLSNEGNLAKLGLIIGSALLFLKLFS